MLQSANVFAGDDVTLRVDGQFSPMNEKVFSEFDNIKGIENIHDLMLETLVHVAEN
jgi:hypothetical protein